MTRTNLLSNFQSLSQTDRLLLDPGSDTSLDDLKRELNALAHLRTDSRLAFCKRIAVAYMIIVGHAPNERTLTGRENARKFYLWCAENIRTANDKRYSKPTLRAYVDVGFSVNPANKLQEIRAHVEKARHKSHEDAKRGRLILAATISPKNTKAPVSISKKVQSSFGSDVSGEINALIFAWDSASAQARKAFLYMITGAKF